MHLGSLTFRINKMALRRGELTNKFNNEKTDTNKNISTLDF